MDFHVTRIAFLSGNNRLAVEVKSGAEKFPAVQDDEPVVTVNVVLNWTPRTTIGEIRDGALAEARALIAGR